jgi:HK97 family phage prohead protease
MNRMEFRIKDVQLDHSDRKVGGYVNVTERSSELLFSHQRNKWFTEVMKKGVFERALKKNQSIPCLLEHDWNKELAHTSKGTLELREDNIGLRFDAYIEDEEVYQQVKNGEINSCSFGFTVEKQDFEEVNSRCEKRYVHEINLKEISLVKNPAYTGSLVEQRNLEMALQEDEMNKKKTEVIEETVTEVEETVETEEMVEKTSEEVMETVEKSVETEVEVVEEITETDKEEERSVEEVVVDNQEEVDKEVVKELVEDAIEQKEQQVDYHEEMSELAEEYAEDLMERAEEVQNESIMHEIQALRLRTELLRLRQVKNKL